MSTLQYPFDESGGQMETTKKNCWRAKPVYVISFVVYV